MTTDTDHTLSEALDLAKYAESYSREFMNKLERKPPEELGSSDLQLIAERLSEICEKYRELIVKVQGSNA